jgi:hypothetical protein
MKKEEILKAIRALSNIEWYLIKEDKCIPSLIIWEHFDYINNILLHLLDKDEFTTMVWK